MSELNLLSPAEKDSVNKLKIYFLIKSISFVMVSLLLIVSIILLFTYLILNNNYNVLDRQISEETLTSQGSKIKAIQEKTAELNSQLKQVAEIQSKYINWTEFLIDFSASVPDGIKLEHISFNNSSENLRLTGVAAERDDLVSLQNNLKKSRYFTNIQTPISNLLQKENISFEITGNLTDAFYD